MRRCGKKWREGQNEVRRSYRHTLDIVPSRYTSTRKESGHKGADGADLRKPRADRSARCFQVGHNLFSLPFPISLFLSLSLSVSERNEPSFFFSFAQTPFGYALSWRKRSNTHAPWASPRHRTRKRVRAKEREIRWGQCPGPIGGSHKKTTKSKGGERRWWPDKHSRY